MKALTLWQPWASAIAVGAKRNETRSWPAVSSGHAYRGWLAITAAKRTKDDSGTDIDAILAPRLMKSLESAKLFQTIGTVEPLSYPKGPATPLVTMNFNTLPLGKVVAVVWLDNCHPTHTVTVTERERLWGDYSPGRYAWMFTEVWRINEPWAVTGGQKIFDLEMPPRWQDQATKVF